ncbi:MAG: helix-turn-helix domain-containing protein [Actinophytocola sp.]|nr:helix-turn-helix domain-containing protein [Actinophytocola sp.]
MSRKRTERERERQREFGRRIQRLREEQGLTQGDVTRMSGMDRSFISNLETGVYSIASARLPDLATGLRIDLVDVFEEEHGVRNKDEVASAPRYMELVDFISKEIASGLLRPGDFLPREVALCQCYGYSSFAIRKALAILRGRGLIRSWGEKHFVASPDDLKPIELGDGDRIVVRMPTPTEMFHYAIPEGVPILICRRSGTTTPDEIYQADRFYLQIGRTAHERADAHADIWATEPE